MHTKHSMIHPQIRDEFETGASHMWHDDPFAGGAFESGLRAAISIHQSP